MCELVLAIFGCIAIYKIADADDDQASPIPWTIVMVLATIAAVAVLPWPFLRVVIAVAGVFMAMIGYKMVTDR